MPPWLMPILAQAGKFIGMRFLHFLIYAALGLGVFGVYKNFTKDTTTNKTNVQIKEVKTYNACPDVSSQKKHGFAGVSLWPPRVGVSWEK